MRIKSCLHTTGVDKSDWDKVTDKLKILADYVYDHCDAHQLPLVITSIIRPKIKGVSVSNTHAEGRAFDISVRGWSYEDIMFLVDCCNEDLNIGAISFSDGKEREAIFEDDVFRDGKQIKWRHIHLQVSRT